MVVLAFVGCIFKVFIEGVVMFIGGALIFIGGALIFISKESSCIGGRLFKVAKAKVNRYNLRQRLIIYKLKGPLLLINSLISIFNYSVGLSSWAILYSAYSTNLLFLLKTHTLLYWSIYLSSLIVDLSVSLNIYILKLLKSS